MYAVCSRYCRDQYDAQEAFQKGFIKVFEHIKEFRFNGSFEGWIRKIMIRSALNQLKTKKTISFEEIEEVDKVKVEIHENMTYQSLVKLIQKLPEGYAVVFSMYVLDEMSHFEIAQILQISESTSRSQLSKARKLLRNYIDKEINLYQ